jgi:tRNA1Val (adenine37-N6)-methyltransferase
LTLPFRNNLSLNKHRRAELGAALFLQGVKMTTIKINDNLSLIQNENGLTFGTDAYLLAACTVGGRNKVGADLGSGTGIIPLLLSSRNKAAKIYAVEVQESFCDLIDRNAKLNGFDGRIIPVCKNVTDLKAKDLGEELDFVVSNPPYMKVNSGKRNEFDEKYIARHEVCGDIGDFCACANRLLKHGGKFYCVYRPDRICDLLCAMRESKLEPKVITFVAATAESEPSMVLVRAIKGGASGNTVTRTLFLHNSKEDAAKSILSEDAKAIYENCSFEEFLGR